MHTNLSFKASKILINFWFKQKLIVIYQKINFFNVEKNIKLRIKLF